MIPPTLAGNPADGRMEFSGVLGVDPAATPPGPPAPNPSAEVVGGVLVTPLPKPPGFRVRWDLVLLALVVWALLKEGK